MKTAAIIAEYNPFHKGHKYQIDHIRQSGFDYCIVLMSSDWVQRGAPALLSKYERTKMALLSGADMVLELPSYLSCASAKDFAYGAVSLLNHTGLVDSLCYGCESNDQAACEGLSDFLAASPKDFDRLMYSKLKEGMSYPRARKAALSEYTLNGENLFTPSELSYLDSPNNILALEYNIALKQTQSDITPLPLLRIGNAYHEDTLKEGSFASATAIRSLLTPFCSNGHAALSGAQTQTMDILKEHIPGESLNILIENINNEELHYEDQYSQYLKYKLLTENDFTIYKDVSEALSDKINKKKFEFIGFTSFIESLKSRDLT